jgi:hypothetical protein
MRIAGAAQARFVEAVRGPSVQTLTTRSRRQMGHEANLARKNSHTAGESVIDRISPAMSYNT